MSGVEQSGDGEDPTQSGLSSVGAESRRGGRYLWLGRRGKLRVLLGGWGNDHQGHGFPRTHTLSFGIFISKIVNRSDGKTCRPPGDGYAMNFVSLRFRFPGEAVTGLLARCIYRSWCQFPMLALY